MTNDFDAITADLAELKALVGEGGWNPLPSAPADVLVFVRPWPDGSVDTLIIRGQPEVSAERTNPIGHPVWRHRGTVTEVIDALRKVPEPESPAAPQSILPQDSPDRTL